ncbi:MULTISPECIES: hypothetical protein [unclassified Janthinobacterium]|uniref:hypothetical protein n=1 Tax=unclassified Janthinobacterium TaxID=2610881 RepID=UPI001113E3EB|nr:MULTISPECIES: hypothetical protein [unclassified Janthinobacterium]
MSTLVHVDMAIIVVMVAPYIVFTAWLTARSHSRTAREFMVDGRSRPPWSVSGGCPNSLEMPRSAMKTWARCTPASCMDNIAPGLSWPSQVKTILLIAALSPEGDVGQQESYSHHGVKEGQFSPGMRR